MGPFAWVWGVLAGVAAVASGKPSGSRPPPGSGWTPTPGRTDARGHRTPPGPEYRADRTPLALPKPSTAASRQLFVQYAVRLAADSGLLAPGPALLFAAHMARELGWGHAVFNNNFGNVKQFGTGPWHRLADHEPYVTYRTPAEGFAANVALLRDKARYAAPWRKLLAEDPTWYGDLGRAGYYEGAPEAAQREYNGVLALVRRAAA